MHFVITLPSLSDKDHLQTIEILQLYLEKTRIFYLDKHHKLFLSWCPTHKPVMTDTLARWIREVMQAAGINIKAFGAHSVRGASASFALNQHASIDSVLPARDWSCLQTFNKNYTRVNKSLPTKKLSMTISSGNIYNSSNNQYLQQIYLTSLFICYSIFDYLNSLALCDTCIFYANGQIQLRLRQPVT